MKWDYGWVFGVVVSSRPIAFFNVAHRVGPTRKEMIKSPKSRHKYSLLGGKGEEENKDLEKKKEASKNRDVGLRLSNVTSPYLWFRPVQLLHGSISPKQGRIQWRGGGGGGGAWRGRLSWVSTKLKTILDIHLVLGLMSEKMCMSGRMYRYMNRPS